MSTTYTPEQMRDKAAMLRSWAQYTEAGFVKNGPGFISIEIVGHIEQLRAHADALEELARLKAVPADVAGLVKWHNAMADEPKRAESKRTKHRLTAAIIESQAARVKELECIRESVQGERNQARATLVQTEAQLAEWKRKAGYPKEGT